jgi:hypothetical protein
MQDRPAHPVPPTTTLRRLLSWRKPTTSPRGPPPKESFSFAHTIQCIRKALLLQSDSPITGWPSPTLLCPKASRSTFHIGEIGQIRHRSGSIPTDKIENTTVPKKPASATDYDTVHSDFSGASSPTTRMLNTSVIDRTPGARGNHASAPLRHARAITIITKPITCENHTWRGFQIVLVIRCFESQYLM